MVIHWSRFRKEVVFYGRELTPRNLGSYRGQDAVGLRRKRVFQEQFFPELFRDIQDVISLILHDRTLQCRLFQHIYYHIGCAFNLHSIINNGLILGGQNSSKRQTVFFLLVDPRDKGHQDPAKIDFTVPRRAQCLEETSRRGILG